MMQNIMMQGRAHKAQVDGQRIPGSAGPGGLEALFAELQALVQVMPGLPSGADVHYEDNRERSGELLTA